ncbi:hypothetical protein GGQ73_000317 [Rhizobium skierniewicense]|uniref:Uncharacterized protein n=1 Tax=Rhizobium skierniewicense TaxID=984260 RepID=A0A7W6C4Q4_9HYPH|nr:hypothetical protein [Rhizobium skierniewicense]
MAAPYAEGHDKAADQKEQDNAEAPGIKMSNTGCSDPKRDAIMVRRLTQTVPEEMLDDDGESRYCSESIDVLVATARFSLSTELGDGCSRQCFAQCRIIRRMHQTTPLDQTKSTMT